MNTSRFDQYGNCWCRKPIEASRRVIYLQIDGRQLKLDAVPQGVCQDCGFTFYKAEVLEAVEALMREDQRERRCNGGPA